MKKKKKKDERKEDGVNMELFYNLNYNNLKIINKNINYLKLKKKQKTYQQHFDLLYVIGLNLDYYFQ
jgi:hypothetical protein